MFRYAGGREPVPVTGLTGFLGSGKITLLNRILNGQHDLRVGMLVNDFDAINIDTELVDGVEEKNYESELPFDPGGHFDFGCTVC